MNFYWNTNVFGWRMYGLVGRNAAWFVGVSIRPKALK